MPNKTRGRPPEPHGNEEVAQLKIRISGELKNRLAREAKKEHRSIAAEAAIRLGKSLETGD